MKIAVTSQDGKTITGHAGRCQRFWLFEVEGESILDKQLLEIRRNQTLRENHSDDPHPLDGIDVFITGGMGRGLKMRLQRKGIEGLVTTETDPDQAVSLFLRGELEVAGPHEHHSCSCGGHDHGHGHYQQ